MGVVMDRIWGGIVAAFRFGKRCLDVFCAVTAAFGALLYLGGSGHAGHFLNGDEYAALMVNALGWMTQGLWR